VNYKPVVGYFFYGASDSTKRASFAVSYGLLETAPVPPSIIPGFVSNLFMRFKQWF